jgi:BirA family biotin operon repressor/biotin-[acetyl-CoA-carboxylase] ligase
MTPFRIEPRGRIDSSNDEARRLALTGAGHGTLVTAVEQTKGRGRRGRVWQSPPGNLHCSLLLDPGPDPTLAPQLAFVAGLALQSALSDLVAGVEFRVKWPNDILCRRAKIAGMLLEQVGPLVILGVGVNIVEHPEGALYPATSLRKAGSGASASDLLAGFCDAFALRYDGWRAGGFAALRAAWLAVASGLGEEVTARLADGRVLQGRFAGLAADGALALASRDGTLQSILAADIFFDGMAMADATGN